MGFFSTNEHSNLYRSYEFPVVEGYDGTVGCGLALMEGYQNDLALFTAAVVSDLNEMASLNEGASAFEVQALQEASISGMLEAIKKFFVKLGAKIKAIFTAFMAKLESYFTKDLKAYVKKYERSLDKKDFKDMKVKCMLVKGDKYTLPEVYKADGYNFSKSVKISADADKQVEDDYENTDRDDYIKEAYTDIVAGANVETNAEFDDWYKEQLFNDEEVKDDWDYAKVRAIAARLTNETKCLSEIKTFYDKLQNDIKKILKEIDTIDKNITKQYKGNDTGKSTVGDVGYKVGVDYTRSNKGFKQSGAVSAQDGSAGSNEKGRPVNLSTASKAVSILRQKASAFQDVVLHISQTVMKEAKHGIAQDKKVFAAAVAYKATTTESTLLDMIAECAYDETLEALDSAV